MNSDRWNRIEGLYHSALELDASDREAFLEQQSLGDKSLKNEVLSLLASADRQDSFMEEPAATLALEVLRSERTGLIGKTVARYQIVDVLGHGGMGEVYLAHDPSLNRKVALKLLPATITDNRPRVLRFQQEARAASAISHPNVAHIYEIGEANGLHYITMEYVKGATVRELLKTEALDEAKTLEISKQVCSALGAAHKAGVIHRDIKPENIVVTDDGHVKVLDFGLAKLIEGVRDEPEFHGTSTLNTQPELLMGTSHYMSPEQIRRQAVDCRTDLWSLGVVLFELVLHRRPFAGETTSEVIVAILEHEPDNSVTSELLSPEMTSVLLKSLRKDLNERYQSAEELLHDLRQIDAIRSANSRPPAAAGINDNSDARNSVTTEMPRPITVGERIDTVPNQTQGPAPVMPGPVMKSTFRKLALIMPLFLIAAAASYYILKTKPNTTPVTTPITTSTTTLLNRPFNLRFERLHISGDISEIVISPDGKYVAYSVVEAGKHSIHVKELATASDGRVTSVSNSSYSGLSFSPDGAFVYYLENQAETGTLYRVSKFGGQRRILENVNTAVTFSPDGSAMAFVRSNNAVDPADLVIAPADGGSSSVLARRTLADNTFFFSDMHGPGPAWSPNGKSIACVTHGLVPKLNEVSLELIDLESGKARPIKAGPWYYISRITWLGDGSGLIVAATKTAGGPGQLYLVGDQVTRQITNDPNSYTLVSGSSDSNVFVTLSVERSSSIWRMSLVEPPLATFNVKQQKGLAEVERGTEGRLIYSVFDGQNINLWLQDASGKRQLTFEANNFKPTMSPDGRYIVFCSTRAGTMNIMNIWRMNSDGTQPLQLTTGTYEDLPSVTADSKWVIYRTGNDIRQVSIDGGPSQILLSREVQGPSLSPDGRLLAFFVNDQPDSQVWHLEIYDLTLRSIVKRFALPDSTRPFNRMSFTPDNRLRWTPDGKGLAYVSSSSGASNIWIQPLDGGQFRKLTDFKEAEITSFAWSDDGRQIVLVQDTRAYVPVLVRLF